MQNKRMLLLSTMFLSTSSRNTAKYTTDKKARKKAKGASIGFFFLYLMIASYSGLLGWGFAYMGFPDILPGITVITLWAISFMFTLFKTNGYLFNFREYDMIMAMPFPVKTIIADRFLYMYVKSLPWYVSLSLPMIVMYAIFGESGVLGVVFFTILSFVAPVIPMILATAIGALIAKAGSGFKYKKIAQSVITMIIVIPLFFSRFIFEGIFRNDEEVVDAFSNLSGSMGGFTKWIPPVQWFINAVNEESILSFVLLIAVTTALFELFFLFLAKYYRQINSDLSKTGAHTKAKSSEYKKRGMIQSIAFKEMKRFLGSTTYTVNIGMGQFLALIVSVAALILKPQRILDTIANGAPLTVEMMVPAVPFIVYFFIGMVASTACSPSLEGKNYWIIQSLPIDKFALYKGKMLFNIYITVPFAALSTFLFCLSAKTSALYTILCIVLSIALCLFSTVFGMVCGIKYISLEWENEIEVIKKGAAVGFYILPNMLVSMGLVVLAVVLGMKMSITLLLVICIVIAALLAVFEYLRVIRLVKKETK